MTPLSTNHIGIKWLAQSDAFKALAEAQGVTPEEAAANWYAQFSPPDPRVARLEARLAEMESRFDRP